MRNGLALRSPDPIAANNGQGIVIQGSKKKSGIGPHALCALEPTPWGRASFTDWALV